MFYVLFYVSSHFRERFELAFSVILRPPLYATPCMNESVKYTVFSSIGNKQGLFHQGLHNAFIRKRCYLIYFKMCEAGSPQLLL